MLCFLPPIAAVPPQPPPPKPRPPIGPSAVTAIVVLIVGLSALTPIGWTRTEPEYPIRVGHPTTIGPRTEERALARAVQQYRPGFGPPTFRADRSAYTTMPPGLRVDPTTGALTGTPTIPGTYRVAIGVTDSHTGTTVGPTFRVKVLP